jgi:hypothetical protein
MAVITDPLVPPWLPDLAGPTMTEADWADLLARVEAEQAAGAANTDGPLRHPSAPPKLTAQPN